MNDMNGWPEYLMAGGVVVMLVERLLNLIIPVIKPKKTKYVDEVHCEKMENKIDARFSEIHKRIDDHINDHAKGGFK